MSEIMYHVLADFMNLVDAVERDAHIVGNPSIDLEECRVGINEALSEMGYSETDIPRVWSGEIQLTSS